MIIPDSRNVVRMTGEDLQKLDNFHRITRRCFTLRRLVIFLAILFSSEYSYASDQLYTLFYDTNEVIRKCAFLEVNDTILTIEYCPILPRAVEIKSIPLKSISAIRVRSQANELSPYGAYIGVFVAVSLFGPKNEDEKVKSQTGTSDSFSEALSDLAGAASEHLFADILPRLVISSGVGGISGYFTTHLVLGGNNPVIRLYDLSLAEKKSILSEKVERSNRLKRFKNEIPIKKIPSL